MEPVPFIVTVDLKQAKCKRTADSGCMLQGAREQFRKVLRLVQLNQFQSARLQLREGSASTLRKDLRDVEGLYPGVSSEVRLPTPSNLPHPTEN